MYEKKIINPLYISYSGEANPYKIIRGKSYLHNIFTSRTRDRSRAKYFFCLKGFRLCMKRK